MRLLHAQRTSQRCCGHHIPKTEGRGGGARPLQSLSQFEKLLSFLWRGTDTESQRSLLNPSQRKEGSILHTQEGMPARQTMLLLHHFLNGTPRLSASNLVMNLPLFAKPFPPAFHQVLKSLIPSRSCFLPKATIPFLEFPSLFHSTRLHLFITAQPPPIPLSQNDSLRLSIISHKVTFFGFHLFFSL